MYEVAKAKNLLSKQRLGKIATISENIATFHILSCTHLIIASYLEAHMWTAMFSTKRSVYFSLLRESNFLLCNPPSKIEYLNTKTLYVLHNEIHTALIF